MTSDIFTLHNKYPIITSSVPVTQLMRMSYIMLVLLDFTALTLPINLHFTTMCLFCLQEALDSEETHDHMDECNSSNSHRPARTLLEEHIPPDSE